MLKILWLSSASEAMALRRYTNLIIIIFLLLLLLLLLLLFFSVNTV